VVSIIIQTSRKTITILKDTPVRLPGLLGLQTTFALFLGRLRIITQAYMRWLQTQDSGNFLFRSVRLSVKSVASRQITEFWHCWHRVGHFAGLSMSLNDRPKAGPSMVRIKPLASTPGLIETCVSLLLPATGDL